MNWRNVSAQTLAFVLFVYFGAIVTSAVALVRFVPASVDILPIGGLELELPNSATELIESIQTSQPETAAARSVRLGPAIVLLTSLVGTLLLMLPITWIYMATKRNEGVRQSFVTSLLVLPICATSIVLLIQDSLALAFGLAALVAAVRFRVRLNDTLDGIYVFAAICVGLSSGIGYLGVGTVMTVVFCYVSLTIWATNYGADPAQNPRQ